MAASTNRMLMLALKKWGRCRGAPPPPVAPRKHKRRRAATFISRRRRAVISRGGGAASSSCSSDSIGRCSQPPAVLRCAPCRCCRYCRCCCCSSGAVDETPEPLQLLPLAQLAPVCLELLLLLAHLCCSYLIALSTLILLGMLLDDSPSLFLLACLLVVVDVRRMFGPFFSFVFFDRSFFSLCCRL